ncbi:gluconate 2-dehydrogenase subunit 3 family protein [Falsiroseomonas sp. HW251]|uniref:gluconate 2-dehydrogenase subunit 3 family protein n=1 Tax=Falsiroseomonas sp. HW251 TaxID=3390998 RepID=UPI003D31F9C4
MREVDKRTTVRRRVLLRGGAAAPAAIAVAATGGTAVADTRNLQPATMTTIVKAARDIFPHDSFPDRFYVAAVAPYDDQAGANAQLKQLLEEGVAALNAEARRRHGRDYVAVATEDQRVEVLKAQQDGAFFRKLRGDLVVALYNQPDVWAKLGYEGPSWEHGGYLERGFNDIDWLPEA